jgi:hypothetical protein
MAGAPKTGSWDRWSSGRAGAPPHRLRRFAIYVSVIGAPLLSAAGIAVSQNANPSLQAPDARVQAPIGHRQPRPSDLPPDVQRDEQLDAQSVQTQPSARAQPQKQTPNRRARAESVPTIDVRKGCDASEQTLGSIFGPNNISSVGSCLKQEQEARQQIINNWTTYPPVDKQKCIITTAYNQRWSRVFEQNFRVAKWNLCRG